MSLPFMEQTPLYNAINFGRQANGQDGFACDGNAINTTATYRTLAVVLCPSDMDRLTNASGHVNYAGNSGSLPVFYAITQSGAKVLPNGVFASFADNNAESPILRLVDATDGTSNTAAVSERVKGIGNSNTAQRDLTTPTSSIALVPNVASQMHIPQPYQLACAALDPRKTSTTLGGARPLGTHWHMGHPQNVRYNHTMPPNSWPCATVTGNNWNGASPPSSRHPGVVNVLFLDGTVRAIKNTVSLPVWWAIGSRAGGEVVSSDSLRPEATASGRVTRRASSDPACITSPSGIGSPSGKALSGWRGSLCTSGRTCPMCGGTASTTS